MTIGHTGIKIPAAHHEAVVAWYEAALAPLGYTKRMSFLDGKVIGFGDSPHGADWYVTSTAAARPGAPAPAGASAASILPTHTAFVAKGECYCFHCSVCVTCGRVLMMWEWCRSGDCRRVPQGGGCC